jgi:hypothetical protein
LTHAMRTITALGFVLSLALTVGSAPPSHAKDLTERFAIGGEIGDNASDTGISIKYWFSEFGFQTVLAMGLVENPTNNTNEFELALSVRALFAATRSEQTHLYLAGGLQFQLIDGGTGQQIDILMGVEHFFTDYFSVAGQLGFGFDLTSDTFALELGRLAQWAGSFHFYF